MRCCNTVVKHREGAHTHTQQTFLSVSFIHRGGTERNTIHTVAGWLVVSACFEHFGYSGLLKAKAEADSYCLRRDASCELVNFFFSAGAHWRSFGCCCRCSCCGLCRARVDDALCVTAECATPLAKRHCVVGTQ